MRPDHTTVSVVLVGAFQTSKFVLDELERGGVLSKTDIADSSYKGLLKDQYVELTIGSWGHLTVIPDNLTIEVSEAPYIRAVDMVLKCLREIAPLSTVRAMGLNVKSSFSFVDHVERDNLGMRLSPPSGWGPWGQKVRESIDFPMTDARHGGLKSVVMRQPRPDGRESGYLDVRVDSASEARGNSVVPGVQIFVNDHHDMPPLAEGEEAPSAHVQTAKMLDVLEGAFDSSIARSMEICDGIIQGSKQA